MPEYSFECPACHTASTQTHERGDCPRTVPCSCGQVMERVIKVRAAANVSKKEPKGKGEKLRENLKKRGEQLGTAPDQAAVERWRSWSRRMSGGRY